MAIITATGQLDVRLLGGFAVAIAGQPLPPTTWRSKRAAALIKLLALEPTHRLHREQVLEALWPERDPEAADNNLRFTLYEARKRLVTAGVAPDAFLTRDGETLVLGPSEALTVDVDAFEQAAAAAWRSDDPEVTAAALNYYTGDLLPEDRYAEWAESRRAALRAGSLALLRRLAELYLKRGNGSTAVAALERLVTAEPSDEAANVRLMKVLARMGERQRALAQYDRLVTVLKRELGADPELATIRLRDDIAAHCYPPPTQAPAVVTPLSATNTIPQRSLPAPVDTLIGREREVAEVNQLLASARLVTLTGPGGVGKTRLALRVADDAVSAFPDGAVFVDLAPLRDPELVVSAMAQAVGVREEPGVPLHVSLMAMIRERRTLLLLDNFEQVAEAAPVLTALLAASPGLKVLVTSRVRLRLRGEREYPVGPLALPEPGASMADAPPSEVIMQSPAVVLFVERAQEAKPSFSLTDSNTKDVEAICQRLDGLPLALELAAAWTKLLPPAAMLARLETGRLALTGGARDLPERQQTIRAAISWSYDLLTAEQQRLFRRLAVFVGGWTVEAAEAVNAGFGDLDIDVLEGIRALVDQSLVVEQSQPDGEPRFSMLETIREFGLAELAASGEEEATRRAHLAYVIGLSDAQYAMFYLPGEHPDVNQRRSLECLVVEHANVRSALGWALEHDPTAAVRIAGELQWFWLLQGHVGEGLEWLKAGLSHPAAQARTVDRGMALNSAGFLVTNYGLPAEAVPFLQEALVIRREAGDQLGVADTLNSLGFTAFIQGDFARAAALSEESIDLARDLGHELIIVASLGMLADAVFEMGDRERATQLLEEALVRARAVGDEMQIASLLVSFGLVAHARGEFEQAATLIEEGLAINRRLANQLGILVSLLHLGRVAMAQGDTVWAISLLEESLVLSSEANDREGIIGCFEAIAQLVGSLGQPTEAVRLLAAAAARRQEFGMPLRPSESGEQTQAIATTRAALGEEAFTVAWAEGKNLSLEEAQALALAVAMAAGSQPTRTRLIDDR